MHSPASGCVSAHYLLSESGTERLSGGATVIPPLDKPDVPILSAQSPVAHTLPETEPEFESVAELDARDKPLFVELSTWQLSQGSARSKIIHFFLNLLYSPSVLEDYLRGHSTWHKKDLF